MGNDWPKKSLIALQMWSKLYLYCKCCRRFVIRYVFLQLWLVSNCGKTYGAVKRMEYANKLIKAGLPVDRYGACFNNRKQDLTLDKDVLQSYKFYLAFENALHCRDYITEKFWVRSLSMGRVPVVWGPSKENVVRLAPTKSFIQLKISIHQLAWQCTFCIWIKTIQLTENISNGEKSQTKKL